MGAREDRLTPAQCAERDRRLAAAPRMSDAELEEFRARVQAWDAQNPDVLAQIPPDKRGY